jgi:hypothetical protein
MHYTTHKLKHIGVHVTTLGISKQAIYSSRYLEFYIIIVL